MLMLEKCRLGAFWQVGFGKARRLVWPPRWSDRARFSERIGHASLGLSRHRGAWRDYAEMSRYVESRGDVGGYSGRLATRCYGPARPRRGGRHAKGPRPLVHGPALTAAPGRQRGACRRRDAAGHVAVADEPAGRLCPPSGWRCGTIGGGGSSRISNCSRGPGCSWSTGSRRRLRRWPSGCWWRRWPAR